MLAFLFLADCTSPEVMCGFMRIKSFYSIRQQNLHIALLRVHFCNSAKRCMGSTSHLLAKKNNFFSRIRKNYGLKLCPFIRNLLFDFPSNSSNC
jgi:hypothetical protein